MASSSSSAAASSAHQPKGFWGLIEQEQNTGIGIALENKKQRFKNLCTSTLSRKPGDRQYWLHMAIQEQCPLVESALKDMGVRICSSEEEIANELIPMPSSRIAVEKYGKPHITAKSDTQPLSLWQGLIKNAVGLEQNLRKELSKDPEIDRRSVSKRVGTTFHRYFTSLKRAGWDPNQGTPKPLHAAVEGNCPMVAETMILQRADLNSIENGETPLARAARLGHSDVGKILKKHASGGSVGSESKKPESAPA